LGAGVEGGFGREARRERCLFLISGFFCNKMDLIVNGIQNMQRSGRDTKLLPINGDITHFK
jgi:hypothetical protein